MLELSAELEKYIVSHSEEEPVVLQALARATYLRTSRPRMLSGNLQGQLLKMLCQMIGAEKVLEVGTFTGYAAIAMAAGIREGGQVHTIDNNDELEELVQEYITRSGFQDRITFHLGDASELIPRLEETFDLVFIDADKRQYAEYYQLVFDKLRPGGLLIADDVLWDGKVLDETSQDAQTRGIRAFNEMVQADERVENVLLPLRHGLMIVRKKD